MVKILILRWIIMHCDRRTFTGMRWEDRENGIFSLYWKHQSSRSCRENTTESGALYEYYRAWARHKNNNRRRKPRDLKAAFRNALEKKPELERLTHMDSKERIYWKIKNFPNGQNESCAPIQPSDKKPKTRGRKPKHFVQDSAKFNVVNYGSSTSTAGEDVFPEQKKPKKPSKKESKKNCEEAQEYLANEEVVNCFPGSHEMANNQSPLPSIETFKTFNYHANSSWEDSLNTAQTTHFLEKPYEKLNAEDRWTPQYFSHTPPPQSSDLLGVSSTEIMEPSYRDKMINYSFQPTPPPETTDILDLTDADLVIIRKLVSGEEPKYSFPFQPEEVSTSQPHLTNTPPPTSLHCSQSDFASPMKTLNTQSNNCVLDSRTTSHNAFVFDQRQCSSDQVVPPFHEAFLTHNKQQVDVPGMLANDCLLYSPQPVANHGQNLEKMCPQQIETVYHSSELLRYNDQTSSDDSGISDMDYDYAFLDQADILLENMISQSNKMC